MCVCVCGKGVPQVCVCVCEAQVHHRGVCVCSKGVCVCVCSRGVPQQAERHTTGLEVPSRARRSLAPGCFPPPLFEAVLRKCDQQI